jgi:hypothetical protein
MSAINYCLLHGIFRRIECGARESKISPDHRAKSFTVWGIIQDVEQSRSMRNRFRVAFDHTQITEGERNNRLCWWTGACRWQDYQQFRLRSPCHTEKNFMSPDSCMKYFVKKRVFNNSVFDASKLSIFATWQNPKMTFPSRSIHFKGHLSPYNLACILNSNIE